MTHRPIATHRTIRAALAATALAAFPVLAAHAQDAPAPPCDATLLAKARGPQGYARRGDRCEGIYVREVSGTALYVASLTEHFEAYVPQAGDTLRVEWTAPDSGLLRLRARGLRRDLFYGMDAERPAAAGTFAWPAGILAAQRIRRDDVGVVGTTRRRVGGVERTVHVPLRIRHGAAAPRTGGYDLVLYSSVRLSELFVSVAPVGPDGRPGTFLKRDEPLRRGYYPAERTVTVRLEELPAPGLYYVQVGARLASGAPVALDPIYVLHAP